MFFAFYKTAFKSVGRDAPQFSQTDSTTIKVINSDYLKRKLNYTFIVDDVLDSIDLI